MLNNIDDPIPTSSQSRMGSSTKLRLSFNDGVVLGNSLYGFNRPFFCMDAMTGERKWQGGRYGLGQAMLLKKAG